MTTKIDPVENCSGDETTTIPTRPCWKTRPEKAEKVRQRDVDNYKIRASGLCVKESGSVKHVLLVTNRKDKTKWAVPGGGIENGECAEEAAHRELLEEAGVRVRTLERVIILHDDSRKLRNNLFLMEVLEELEQWEEREYGRQRIWMPIVEALEKVKDSHRSMIEAVMLK